MSTKYKLAKLELLDLNQRHTGYKPGALPN